MVDPQTLLELQMKSPLRPVKEEGLYRAVERHLGGLDFLTIYTSRFILSGLSLEELVAACTINGGRVALC